MGEQAPLVGREAEARTLSATVERAATGSPTAVLVAGEAGAGKTRLVRETADAAAQAGHVVLWGSCLRFAADTSPFLPIGRLLTQWYRQATPEEHDRVLAGAGPLATIAPALGTPNRTMDPGQLIPLAAAVLDRIVAESPTVVVVDDLQWADGASLDLLAYVLAGFAPGQQLAVLATYRDTDLVEGHRLHGWLADTLRLPAVQRLRLERLGLTETEDLVAGLLGRTGAGSRGAEVFSRSDGNPYLTELLVRHDSGPSRAGDGLDQMLLASWHRLGDAAREVLQLLAVGGRPVDVEVLERLVAARGSDDVVRPSIAEAAGEGLVVREAGRVWFHHPLVAEVIAATVEPADLVGIHQGYVAVLEADTELAPASRAAYLALHHHGASHPDEAFIWSLHAADEARQVRGFDEVSGHLHRACELWEQVSPDVRARAGERPDLLERASVSARSAGDLPLALRLREQAIALVDPASDPVRAVRLRLPLHELREMSGLEVKPEVEVSRAILEIAERSPGSAEHAMAVASLANAEFWNGRPEAAEHAEEAVRLAVETASDEALATALAARSQTRFGTPGGLEDAEQAFVLAGSTGDAALLGTVGFHQAMAYMRHGRIHDVADTLLDVYRRVVSIGSVHDAMFSGPAITALTLADVGRMDEARGLMRELLSRRLAPDEALDARICAAVLALRTGDAASAENHLARVGELLPAERVAGRFVNRVEIQARCLAGQAEQALDLVETLLPGTVEIQSSMADELLLWATRSCADLAEKPDRRPAAVARLDRIEDLRGDGPRYEARGPDDLLHPARGRLQAAERARCRGEDPDLPDLWAAAATSCGEAGLVWEEALAEYRLAQAVLTSRGPRGVAAAALRRGARIAADIDARPILDDVVGLARQARIPLEEPSGPEAGPSAPPDSVWTKLTGREQEVLAHLVAGRTYAEIAAALFISEKTVSVHVSNVLRKTGTSNRVEAAELARASADHGPTGPSVEETGRPGSDVTRGG